MSENTPNTCAGEGKCPGLARLEQQLDDLRRQNGSDHKDFRERMIKIEMEEARQKERFDRIMDTLTDVRTDNKTILTSISSMTYKVEALEELSDQVDKLKEQVHPLHHKLGSVDKLNNDVEDIKYKPAQNWNDMVKQIGGIIIAAVAGMVMVKMGFVG